MKINELKPKQGKVDIILDITEKGDIRTFDKFGKPGKVCNASASDGTDSIKLTLWNEQIDTVNEGSKVHITNGYVNEYQGELQLTTGKFGKLELVNKDESLTNTQTTNEGEKVITKDEKTESNILNSKDSPPAEEELSNDELEENVEEEILDESNNDPDKEKI